MPAEHDGHERHDSRGDVGDHDGGSGRGVEDDALLAVLMDGELSDVQRADPVFMAEHRAAAADVALLRARLGILGDALAVPPQPPQPQSRPVGRPRPRLHPGVRALGLAGALAAAFASAVFGIGWLASHSGSESMSKGASSDAAAGSASGAKGQEQAGGPGYLACARLVVEGTVTAVREIPDVGEARVTLRVTRAYKPAKTAEEVRFPLASGTDTRIRVGVRLLVGITRGQQTPDRLAVGESEIAPERTWIIRDLPTSRTQPCQN
ncbi:hypothetical protein [Streptomyces arenae]|uniref:hypothetical protein n=1 Tax=Streptomyces arenae TaxID=29301 RepID=UPI002659CCBD|nr:hypothetical protein [Streptomyces arenae]MCG7205701.1 hypothetical protein [Streptomyces arenae]